MDWYATDVEGMGGDTPLTVLCVESMGYRATPVLRQRLALME